jgi:hypothetical protein
VLHVYQQQFAQNAILEYILLKNLNNVQLFVLRGHSQTQINQSNLVYLALEVVEHAQIVQAVLHVGQDLIFSQKTKTIFVAALVQIELIQTIISAKAALTTVLNAQILVVCNV